jgi:hypothetical protein
MPLWVRYRRGWIWKQWVSFRPSRLKSDVLWGIFGTTESEASPEQENCQEGGSWAQKSDKNRPFPLKNNHFQAKKWAKTMVCRYWLINSKKS